MTDDHQTQDDHQTHRKTMRDGKHDFSPLILAAAAAKESAKLEHIHPDDADRAYRLVMGADRMGSDIKRAIEQLELAKGRNDPSSTIDRVISTLKRTVDKEGDS